MSRKALLSLLLALCLTMPGCAAAAQSGIVVSKSTQGFGGEVSVEVTFEDGVITAVKAKGENETAGIGSRAVEALPSAVIAANSADVDIVSGATVTSKAILLCVKMAVDEANGVKPVDAPQFVPGTYAGSAMGFGGRVEVFVIVDEEKICGIEIVSESETDGIGTTAIERMPQRIVEKQSLGVDVVSGCTASSKAVLLAVENALESSGVNMAILLAPCKADEPDTKVVALNKDIVVIGAGAAGKVAAIAAKEKGADVLLLEKMAFVGGAAAISGGHVISTGSRHQIEGGVTGDTPDILYDDLIKGGHNLNDPFMARLLADNVGEAFDWLNDYVGVQFEKTPSANASHSMDRDFYHPAQSAGINADIKKKILSDGIAVMLETRAYELKAKEGKVTGVLARDAAGVTYDISAKAVILCTGGFGNNPDLLPENLKRVLYYGPVSSTGDGLLMAEKLGAKTQKLELGKVRGNGIKVAEGLSKSTTNGNKAAVRNGCGILVNQSGVRVVNENGTNDSVTKALMAQEEGILYFVMDSASYELFHAANVKANVVSDEQAEIWLEGDFEYPIYVSGATIEEAAQKAGVDGDHLISTIQQYNSFVKNGVDEDFGRNVLNAEFGEGPYYIVEQRARFASTLGGLVTTAGMEVLDEQGAVIEGLYAAGEIVGGAHGDDALPGCNLGWAYTTGRMAAYAAWEKYGKK